VNIVDERVDAADIVVDTGGQAPARLLEDDVRRGA
jgi:hypothetical protein